MFSAASSPCLCASPLQSSPPRHSPSRPRTRPPPCSPWRRRVRRHQVRPAEPAGPVGRDRRRAGVRPRRSAPATPTGRPADRVDRCLGRHARRRLRHHQAGDARLDADRVRRRQRPTAGRSPPWAEAAVLAAFALGCGRPRGSAAAPRSPHGGSRVERVAVGAGPQRPRPLGDSPPPHAPSRHQGDRNHAHPPHRGQRLRAVPRRPRRRRPPSPRLRSSSATSTTAVAVVATGDTKNDLHVSAYEQAIAGDTKGRPAPRASRPRRSTQASWRRIAPVARRRRRGRRRRDDGWQTRRPRRGRPDRRRRASAPPARSRAHAPRSPQPGV